MVYLSNYSKKMIKMGTFVTKKLPILLFIKFASGTFFSGECSLFAFFAIIS